MMYGLRTTFCRHRLQDCHRAACAHVSAGQVIPGAKTWCGRRDLNPHGPFKPCGFSYRLRLSPPGRDALGELTLVCGLDYPFTILRKVRSLGAARLVSTPSRLGLLRAWLGIAI